MADVSQTVGLSTVVKWAKMDIIVGGGKYGCIAVEYLRKSRRGFVLIDKDPKCLAAKTYRLNTAGPVGAEGEYFLRGDMAQVLEIIESLKPEYVFPTAPVHIAAELAQNKFEFSPWNEAIDCILAYLPASVILQAGRGNIIVSYNRDKACLEKCESPEVCPSTGRKKPCTMDRLMKFACPKSVILVSYQLAPGIGALKGFELLKFLGQAEKQEKIIVATACGCHGFFTALQKVPCEKVEI
jgi:hypothetical protein